MKITRPAKLILGGSALLWITGLLLVGCASTPGPVTPPRGIASKGGAQLWAESCARCHNVRSPSTYGDAEWEVAMHHMRIRANLTADESARVLEFLKSAN